MRQGQGDRHPVTPHGADCRGPVSARPVLVPVWATSGQDQRPRRAGRFQAGGSGTGAAPVAANQPDQQSVDQQRRFLRARRRRPSAA